MCSPLWQDFDNLLLSFYDAFAKVASDPRFREALNTTEFLAEYPNRNDIRPCVIAARQLKGADTDIRQACRTTVCYGIVRGLKNPSGMCIHFIVCSFVLFSLLITCAHVTAFSEGGLGAIGGLFGDSGMKRQQISSLQQLTGTVSFMARSLAQSGNNKRQSSSTDTQQYDASYTVEPVSGGASSSLGGLNGGNGSVGSSAAALFVSAVVVALVGLVALL